MGIIKRISTTIQKMVCSHPSWETIEGPIYGPEYFELEPYCPGAPMETYRAKKWSRKVRCRKCGKEKWVKGLKNLDLEP
ncbi:MAG: hypothetical protein HGA38_03290 [Candidatus Moranbacteria bacterium]|nr:hypothetical protein [Candidatus Moranbacteria bacterium]